MWTTIRIIWVLEWVIDPVCKKRQKESIHSKKNPGKIPNCVWLHCFFLSSKGFIPMGLILGRLGIFPWPVRDSQKSTTIQFFLVFTMVISVKLFFLNPKGIIPNYEGIYFPLLWQDLFLNSKGWISPKKLHY